MQPKKALSSVADESYHPLVTSLLASPLSFCICVISHLCLQTLVHRAFEFSVTKKRDMYFIVIWESFETEEGNFLDHKKKEGFQFNASELEAQMIG